MFSEVFTRTPCKTKPSYTQIHNTIPYNHLKTPIPPEKWEPDWTTEWRWVVYKNSNGNMRAEISTASKKDLKHKIRNYFDKNGNIIPHCLDTLHVMNTHKDTQKDTHKDTQIKVQMDMDGYMVHEMFYVYG